MGYKNESLTPIACLTSSPLLLPIPTSIFSLGLALSTSSDNAPHDPPHSVVCAVPWPVSQGTCTTIASYALGAVYKRDGDRAF